MKKFLIFSVLFFAGQHLFADKINWMTWEEAIAANRKNPKMIFIDVYTGWCGWCKVMDKNTFTDSLVIDFMNRHFYAVKFDAEQKGDVKYNDHVFRYNATYKSHELAVSLLDGQMSYPSFVVLNGKEQRMTIMKGYQEAAIFLANLKTLKESNK